MENVYSVNGTGFMSYMQAVAFAQANNADVIQIDNGQRRWTPIIPKAVRRVKHVILNADGTETEFSRVRR